MTQLGPLLSDAGRHIAAADDLEGAVDHAPLSEAGLGVLGHLAEAQALISTAAKAIALHLAENHGVSRRDLARVLDVSPTTVQRWIQEARNSDTPK